MAQRPIIARASPLNRADGAHLHRGRSRTSRSTGPRTPPACSRWIARHPGMRPDLQDNGRGVTVNTPVRRSKRSCTTMPGRIILRQRPRHGAAISAPTASTFQQHRCQFEGVRIVITDKASACRPKARPTGEANNGGGSPSKIAMADILNCTITSNPAQPTLATRNRRPSRLRDEATVNTILWAPQAISSQTPITAARDVQGGYQARRSTFLPADARRPLCPAHLHAGRTATTRSSTSTAVAALAGRIDIAADEYLDEDS
jgi:hypothetical protein